ncbi:MAG: acetylglutamate kinase [Burkholderiales bacterium]|nr:acetylglutamate kinase [Burkholderiales bacterium]
MNPSQKAGILAEALPYLRAFHGKTMVIRFGGEAMADPALKSGFARDVALLRLVGMKIVVVHGGGWGIDDLMRKMGVEVRRYRGHRITDERTLTIVEMALGELNQELTSLINREGGRAIGLDGQDGRFIHACPLAVAADDPDAPDLGYLGDVEHIDTTLIELLLSHNFVPVVMPTGVAADGTTYHINSDRLAGRLARALEAEKLVLMTNVAGVLDRDGQVVPILTATAAETMLRDGVVHGGMEPRVAAALRAVHDGVRSVHIIDGSVPSALLLEVLTAEGVGTALRSDAEPHFFADSRAYLLEGQSE